MAGITNNQMSKRFRNYECVRNKFYEQHDQDGNRICHLSDDEWKGNILEDIKQSSLEQGVGEMWVIFHDKDTNEDGTLARLHAHIILICDDGKSPTRAIELLKSNRAFTTKINSKAGVFRYLTHSTDKAINDRKFRYEISELKCFKKGVQLNMEEVRTEYTDAMVGKENKDNENIEEFIDLLSDDVVDGVVLKREIRAHLIDEFGKTKGNKIFRKYKRGLYEMADTFKEEHIWKMKKSGRDLITIFINGDGGRGKSTLAEYIANYENEKARFDPDEIFTGSVKNGKITPDVFQGFNGEYTTHLDEYDGTVHGFSEFNNVFERIKCPTVSSRGKNLVWTSSLAIISKSKELSDFISSVVTTASKDELQQYANCYHQVARRVPIHVNIGDKMVGVNVYNQTTRKYELKGEFRVNIHDEKERLKFLQSLHEIIKRERENYRSGK